MKSYSLIAPAKINLYLEIVGDRPDGFHELATVFQSIDLADRIDLKPAPPGSIRVDSDRADVPKGSQNLAYEAAELMSQEFPEAFAKAGGVDIFIHKQIPMAAGLAGGSTDAAAVLVGLDLMWDLGLTQIELQTLAAKLGSDVPFCVAGGTVLGTGRGEQLDSLAGVDALYAILGKYRNSSIATPWAYQTYRQRFQGEYARESTDVLKRHDRVRAGQLLDTLASLATGNIDRAPELAGQLRNDFERVVLPEYPAIARLREVFRELAPLGSLLSGSGPTVFALATSAAAAESIRDRARAALPAPDLDLWVAQFTAAGIRPA